MKILNITHNDGDALGCQLVLEFKYGRENVVNERCNYNNVNKTLYDYLKTKHGEFDMIFITDISISENMANWIDKSFSDKVILIDHHGTAQWLNKYSWANVVTHIGEAPVSASELVRLHFNIEDPTLVSIIKDINDYDTWLFSTNGNINAKRLNDLCYLIGLDETLDYFHSQINKDGISEKMKEKYDYLLTIRDREYDNYLELSNKNLVVGKFKDYRLGVCMAEKFTSELGNDLAKLNPELDFILILNMRSGISLRGIKDDINLGLVAKELGNIIGVNGGGHPKSSGISITMENKLSLFQNLFGIEFNNV